MLNECDMVPDVKLVGLEGQTISPADFRGHKLVIYFYPKDDTPGCTREAREFSALAPEFEKEDTWILGVSKDDPAQHRKFIDKHDLKIALATDPEGSACEQFCTWVEKNMYGRKYMGIERSTFLVDRDGQIRRVWRKVKVSGHAEEVLVAAKQLN